MFFFLAYFTLYNRLQFHPPYLNWFKCILFNGWVILYCVYVPQLSYPLICWWTSRLLPCPGYYKQCCDEHWGTCASFNSGFLDVYAQKWDNVNDHICTWEERWVADRPRCRLSDSVSPPNLQSSVVRPLYMHLCARPTYPVFSGALNNSLLKCLVPLKF